MAVKIIACEVMRDEINSTVNAKDTPIEFISMRLHLHPAKLNTELQNIISQSSDYDRIVLCFGMCGGAVVNLKSEKSILTIARVHDCIPLFLGTRQRFDELRKEEIGTFFMTSGWVNGEHSIAADYERLEARFGPAKASKAFKRMYDGYKRMLFIDTGTSDDEENYEKAKKISDFLNLELIHILGNLEYIYTLINGPWDNERFINVRPGKVIEESEFL